MVVWQTIGLEVAKTSLVSIELDLFVVVCSGKHFAHLQSFPLSAL